jgi:non-lysosomal glucosylceramidase
VGRHRFETVPANQFSVFVARGETKSAHVLSTIRPETLRGWNWDLPEGSGTYHALFPYAWFEYDWDALPIRLTQRQFSPVIPGNYRESSYPVGLLEWQIENPSPDPVTVGLMFSWLNDIGRDRGQDRRAGHRNATRRKDGLTGVVLQGPQDAAGEPWNGSYAIMAGAEPGIQLTTCDRFVADDGSDVWADFAADGRLGDAADSRPSRTGEALGAALAATFDLAPGETKRVSFALVWDLPVVEFGSGTCWYKRYTRFFDRSGANAWALGAEALDKRLRPSTPGRRRSWPIRCAPTGTRARSSTSCTTSSTAARSGPTASRSESPDRPAGPKQPQPGTGRQPGGRSTRPNRPAAPGPSRS